MSLHDIYLSIDLEDIQNFISEGREEDLHLEFKRINEPNLSNNDDKKNLAKALSGFANSSGGIVIWGIDARKNHDGIDCADEPVPIQNLQLFLTRLNEFTGTFVSPIVEEVEHRIVEVEQESNTGFVLTYIPESGIGPHMAKSREYRYYKRSGDSFYKMEHFDIADMFGRRPKPNLHFQYDLRLGSSSGNRRDVNIVFGIKNTGKGIAKYPYLKITLNEAYTIRVHESPPTNHIALPEIQSPIGDQSNTRYYGATGDIVIHPNTLLDICDIRVQVRNDMVVDEIEDVIIQYTLHAEGINPKEDEVEIPGYTIMQYAYS